MDCNWIKIYDAAVGGNELDPSNLYDGLTVYVDISEIPSGTEFVGWKDLNGHLLNDSVIKLMQIITQMTWKYLIQVRVM